MKAIVLENDWHPDVVIGGFLKDNPDLFESVDIQTYIKDRDPKSIIPNILVADAILVASTFIYKDQLEDFLDLFLSEGFPTKKLYIQRAATQLNDWKTDPSWLHNEIYEEKTAKILEKGFELFDVREDHDTEFFEDEFVYFPGSKRNKYTYYPVLYSKEIGCYYLETHSWMNLEDVKEEFIEKLNKKNK